MRKFAIAIALVGPFLSAPVFAADMALKAPPPASAPPSWSGAYVGLGVGGRWIDNNWTTTATFNPGGAPILPTTDPDVSFSSTTARGAVYFGYNWQIAPTWVIGLEGDFGGGNNSVTHATIPGLGLVGSGSSTRVKDTWDAGVRARAGYLLTPSLLAYVTGGVAFQRVEADVTCPADTFVCNPAFGTESFAHSRTLTGWTIGGGLEAPVGQNLYARVEYRYADFGTYSFQAIPPVNCCSFGANANLAVRSNIVTAGLAYKFH